MEVLLASKEVRVLQDQMANAQMIIVLILPVVMIHVKIKALVQTLPAQMEFAKIHLARTSLPQQNLNRLYPILVD